MTTIRSTPTRAPVATTASTSSAATTAASRPAVSGSRDASTFTAAASTSSAATANPSEKAKAICDDIGGDNAAELKKLLDVQIPSDEEMDKAQALFNGMKGDLTDDQKQGLLDSILLQMSSKRLAQSMTDLTKKIQDEMRNIRIGF